MTLSTPEHIRLAKLQAVLAANGGRGIEIAEEIDRLIAKRDGLNGLHLLVMGNPIDGFTYRGPYLHADHASECGPEAGGPDWWTAPLLPTDGWQRVDEGDAAMILAEVLAEIVRNEESSDTHTRQDLLADVIRRLEAIQLANDPEMTRDEQGHLVCPHCQAKDQVNEIDCKRRMNEGEVEQESDNAFVMISEDRHAEFHTDHYICGACRRRVALPEGVEVVWP